MKYYTSTTEFNCGIDLHARQMYVCVMDRQGKKLVHTNVRDNDFQFFLKLIEPYKHDLTVCCECMFGWYWVADACQGAGLTFVLAHALYVRAIHGGKNKNDRIDSEKLTHPAALQPHPSGLRLPSRQAPSARPLAPAYLLCLEPRPTAGPYQQPSIGPQPRPGPTDSPRPRSLGRAVAGPRRASAPPGRAQKRHGHAPPLRHPD